MKTAIVIGCFALYCMSAEALWCWHCINAKDNEDCKAFGSKQHCLANENSCHNEVRRGDNGISITKRCKQVQACNNNEVQNQRAAWAPTQCNGRTPSSVCRCCCASDGCNAPTLDCHDMPQCAPLPTPRFGSKRCEFKITENDVGTVCHFTCDDNYNLLGSRVSTCIYDNDNKMAAFDNPLPSCRRIGPRTPPQCPPIRGPNHGNTTCTDGVMVGSICAFECFHDHELVGKEQIVCGRNGVWDDIPPACLLVMCPDRDPPANGDVSCTYGNDEDSECTYTCDEDYALVGSPSSICFEDTSINGVWTEEVPTCERKRCSGIPPSPEKGYVVCDDESYLHSTCEFACNDYHRRIGSLYTQCVEKQNGKIEWSDETPVCEVIQCDDEGIFYNGRMTCTNENFVNSVCTFECEDDFELYPPGHTSNTCFNDSVWSLPRPCCSRVCPADSVLDVVIVVDSSSSIGEENWITMKEFVRTLINFFTIGPNAARVGVFRYNRVVDTDTQILLSDFPDDKAGILAAFDQIPYDGTGTFTGNALRHAMEVLLAPENGNRPDAADAVIVITDGRSYDDISEVSTQLHRQGVHVNAIGVVPPRGRLSREQLREIVSHPRDLTIAESGFEGLNFEVFQHLTAALCIEGCLEDFNI